MATSLEKTRERPGSSNAGKYPDVAKGSFCGPAGGAAAGTYPVNTLERAKSALKLAHNAPNPSGIKSCVYSKYPELKPGHAEGGPTSLYRGMYKKGGKTSLCGLGYAGGGMPEGSPYDNMRYDGNFKRGGKINYLEYRNMYYPLGFGGKEDSGKKHMKKQGYYDREDESDAMRLGKGHSGKKTRDESYGKWGNRKKDWSGRAAGGAVGHMNALKDDIDYDQDHDYNSIYKDRNQTHDEKKITDIASHLRKEKDYRKGFAPGGPQDDSTSTAQNTWAQKMQAKMDSSRAAREQEQKDHYWGLSESEMRNHNYKAGVDDWEKKGSDDYAKKVRSLQGQPVEDIDINFRESTMDDDGSITQPVTPGTDKIRRPINDSVLVAQYMKHKYPGSDKEGGGFAGSSGGGYLDKDGKLSDENRRMMYDEIQTNYGLQGMWKDIKSGASSIYDYLVD